MREKPKHVKFQNKNNALFDIVGIKEVLNRKNLDHSPEESHKVDFFIIILIEKGQGHHTIDFSNYECKPGTLLTIRKDQIHKFIKHRTLDGTLLIFTHDFLVHYLEEMENQKTLLLFNEQLGDPKIQLTSSQFVRIKEIFERMKHEYFKLHDNHSLSIIRSELHILITKLFRIKSKKEEFNLEKKYLKEFIQFQNLVEQHSLIKFKVTEYAKEMNISTKTLNTVCKSIVNKTAKEFVDEVRTHQIKRLLINTKLSVKEIAYHAGFEDPSNLYKYFKRQTQFTPEQFRAAN